MGVKTMGDGQWEWWLRLEDETDFDWKEMPRSWDGLRQKRKRESTEE